MKNNELIEQAKQAIQHYGTKGMKWGVRKKSSRSAESSETSALRKKKGFQLTNDELKTVNARLSLEQSYSQLNPSTISKGKKAILGVAGTIAAVKAITSVIGPAAKYAKKIVSGGS